MSDRRRRHWPMRSGGLGLGLGVGGGGVGYLLNDSFLIARLAGAVHGTAAEPGPGTRTVVDTNSKLSISGGYLVDAGNTPVDWTTLNYRLDAVSRAAGRMMVGKIVFNSPDIAYALSGFSNNTTPGVSAFDVSYYIDSSLNPSDITLRSGTTNIDVSKHTDGTICYYANILKATGAYLLEKIGTGNWYLIYVSNLGSTATVYPAYLSAEDPSNPTQTDFIRVPTMLWTPRPISADNFGSAWPTTDGGGLTGLEAGGSGKTWTTAVGATWSNAGGFAINAPVPGVEKVTNGTFASWDAGIPPADVATGWSYGGTNGVTHYITQDPAGQARLVSPDGVNVYALQAVVVANNWYRAQIDVKAIGAGGINFGVGSAGSSKRVVTVTPADNIVCTGRADNTSAGFNRYSGATDVSVDNYSTKLLATSELIQVIDNGVEDFYAEIDITMAAGFQAGIVFNYVDDSNFEIIYLNRNDAKIYWDKCVAGTYTTIGTAAAFTYAAGAKLAVRKIGTAVYFWYNNIYNANGTSTSGLTGEKQGLFSTGNGATEVKFANWKLYAVGSGGEYSLLDMFCN